MQLALQLHLQVPRITGSLSRFQFQRSYPLPTFYFVFDMFFRFRRRSSRSPSRARSISSSPITPKSLPSCLVHRPPPELTSSSAKLTPIRRPSLPTYQRRQDELTVPLRDCCADCQQITEECLKEGNDWKEKFTRGARRRRSTSLDTATPSSSDTTNNARTFTPFSREGSPGKEFTSRFYTPANRFSITVDEVDKRRKIFDYSMEDTDFIRSLSPHAYPSSSLLVHSPASPFASSSGPRVKARDREVPSNSTVSWVSTADELSPGPDTLDSRNRLRSSPIEEEDETLLFPLPRSSRSNTPSPSLPPSPNGSSFSLSVRIPPCSSKRNSISSQESVLRNSSENEHLTVPSAPSTLPLSPLLSFQLKNTTGERALTRLSSPPQGPRSLSKAKLPPKPSFAINQISDQNSAFLLTPPSSHSPSTNNNILPSLQLETEAVTLAEPLSNTNTNLKPLAPPPSASLGTRRPAQKRKLSFTLPFIKAGGAIRDVGVDVLRGVSSISNSGVVGSF